MSDSDAPRQGRSLVPQQVGEAEWSYLQARRARVQEDPDAPVAGVCLSGGGIRSASFNLGVLQGLSTSGLLRRTDYLSTVSGGGFIGSCFTTLVRHVELNGGDSLDGHGDASAAPESTSSNLDGARMPLNRFAPLGHLRRHAQYLVTRRSLFSAEMLRLVGTILSGLIFTLLLGFMLLLVVISLYLFAVNVIAGDAFLQELFAPRENFPGWAHLPKSMLLASSESNALDPDIYGFLTVGAMIGGIGVLVTYLRSWPPRWREPDGDLVHATGGRTAEQRAQLRHVMGYALGLLALTFGGFAALHFAGDAGGSLHAQLGAAREHRHDAWLLGPLLVSAGAGTAVALMHPLLSRTRRWNRSMRTVYHGMHGVNLALALIFLAFAGTTMLLWWVHERESVLIVILAASFAIVWAGSRERRSEASLREPGLRDRVFDALKIAGAATFVVVGFALITDLIAETLGSSSVMADGPFGWFSLTALGIVGATVVGLAVDFNKVSLNNFYMDRLAESYLATTRKVGGKLRLVRDDGDLPLHHLQGIPDEHGKLGPEVGPPVAPFHLIVGAINLAGVTDLARQEDKSEPFVFSSLYCGSSPTGYVPTEHYRGGATTVAEAVSISGAAVTSAMGSYTTSLLAFGLTLLNLRMGQWLLNPRYYGDKVAFPGTDDYSPHPRVRPRVLWRPNATERLVFWARYLLAEMRAATTAETPLVSVSDGGHTGDNCGIVPLLMRRCRVIICADASYDPQHSCTDFATGVRQILVDENTAVDIDVLALRPDESGRVERPFAIGRVHYGKPSLESRAGWNDHVNGAEIGWIIYLKLAVAKDEPAAVSSYRLNNPAFPHDPTSHQFFREEQLEAYRVLGLVNAKRLLRELDGAEASTESLAAWCAEQWQQARLHAGEL